MTGRIPPDRWTCPDCGHTEVMDSVDDAVIAAGIRLAQEAHARDHAAQLEQTLKSGAQ
jgi:hypothetical protein